MKDTVGADKARKKFRVFWEFFVTPRRRTQRRNFNMQGKNQSFAFVCMKDYGKSKDVQIQNGRNSLICNVHYGSLLISQVIIEK